VTTLAIVGLGRWGKVLVDSVQGRSDAVRFGAAVARDPAKAAADAEARGLRLHGALDAVLRDPGIDGIVLATPHSQHAAQIEACAAAGKPVLVEKPFTLTRTTAEAALAAARRAGTLVAAAHNRRFLKPVVDLKHLIAAGDLGTVLHIETNFSGNTVGRYTREMWRVAPGESPAGGLAGSGIHHIDTIIHLEGPITEVYAMSTRRVHDVPLDDTTSVLFRLASGATASLLTMTATVPVYRIQVFGTRGSAEVRGQAETRGSETLEIVCLGSGERETRTYEPFDIERAELEAFADAIKSRRSYPIPLEEVLNGVAAFEAVPRSAETGVPVSLLGEQ
jgi:predicted dehydrogenase